MSYPLCYTNHMMKMKNEEMELVNDNGTWKIKWNDGFERSFESFFKAKLHFVALVNQQIAIERYLQSSGQERIQERPTRVARRDEKKA